MTEPTRIEAFRAESRVVADALGLPILTPSGAFVADASVAWIVEHVEAWHERSQVPRFDPGWFHASSLGRSDVELLAQYRGEAGDTHTANTLRIFDNGHGRDKAWKAYLKDAGLSICASDEDRRIRINAIKLSGECDDIIRKPLDADGEPIVFEFKTINPYAFGQLQEPKPEHVLQVHAYMAGLALSRAVVCYECKSNQALRVFDVPFNVETWAGVTMRLRRLMREAGPVKAGAVLKAHPSDEGRKKAAALQM